MITYEKEIKLVFNPYIWNIINYNKKNKIDILGDRMKF